MTQCQLPSRMPGLVFLITILPVGLGLLTAMSCSFPVASRIELKATGISGGVEYSLDGLQDVTSTPRGPAIDEYVYLPVVMRSFSTGMGGRPSPTLTPVQTSTSTPIPSVSPTVAATSDGVLTVTVSPTSPPTLTPSFAVYGVVLGEGNTERENKARGAGAEWYRIIIQWSQIEPNPPVDDVHTYNWSVYDNLVTGLWQRGLHPLVEIRSVPYWARAVSEPWRSVDCGLMSSEGLRAYSEFVAALVERSDGDGVSDIASSPVVRYWEIGNEPDGLDTSGSHFGLCYGNHPNEYAGILARSWDAAHEADPEARVVFGGLAYERFSGVFNSDPRDEVPGPDFFDSVLAFIRRNPRSVGGRYFDVMNIHAYSSWMHFYDPPDVRTKYQIVRNKLANCACGLDHVPLVNTEGGRRSDPGQTAWGQPGTPERQSRYVSQLFVRSLAADLRAVFWFATMDFGGLGYGLLTASSEPKEAYWAYKTLTEEMSGLVYRRTLTTADTGSADIEGYVFESVSGKEKWVLWIPPQNGESITRHVAFPSPRVRWVWYKKYEGGSGSPIAGAVREIADGDQDDLGPAGDGKVTLLITVDPVYIEDVSDASEASLLGYLDGV